MMKSLVLETLRLLLHPLKRTDIPDIQSAASVREVADTMISLPHPYPAGEAERYCEQREEEGKAGLSHVFTIRQKLNEDFCGLVELRDIEVEHSQGELSFWLAREAWGQGYMSEVVREAVRFGFEELRLNRLYAYHMLRNPATGRILEKNGFKQEGLLRQRVIKWHIFEDVALWAILKSEWILAEDRSKDSRSNH